MSVRRLAACIIVGVLVGVVIYAVWCQTQTDSKSDPSDSKSKKPTETCDENHTPPIKGDLSSIEEEEEMKEDTIDEGVIKYECEWIKGEIKLNAIQTLLNARNRLHDLGLIGVYQHNGIGFGNISQRIPSSVDDKVSFCVTGTQTSKIGSQNMNEKHFCIVNNYDIPRNKLHCVGPIRASSESMTHATIYELGTDINCIVHIHNNELWKIGMSKLPTTDKTVAYGTPEMAEEVKRIYAHNVGNVQKGKVFVMGGHQDGVVAFGDSIENATNLMVEVYKKYCNVSVEEVLLSEEEESTTDENKSDQLQIGADGKALNDFIIKDYGTPVMAAQNGKSENGNGEEFVEVQAVDSDPLSI